MSVSMQCLGHEAHHLWVDSMVVSVTIHLPSLVMKYTIYESNSSLCRFDALPNLATKYTIYERYRWSCRGRWRSSEFVVGAFAR